MKYFKKFMFSAADGGGSEMTGDSNNQDSADNNGSADDSTVDDKAEKPGEKPPEKTYTQSDIDELNSIIEQLRADFASKLTETAEEAEKKAGMTPEEKTEYEKDKRFADLEKREKEVADKQLKHDALGILKKQDVDEDFLEFILADDLDSTTKRISDFKKLFDRKLYEKQLENLARKTPPANTGGTGNPDLDEFEKRRKKYL